MLGVSSSGSPRVVGDSNEKRSSVEGSTKFNVETSSVRRNSRRDSTGDSPPPSRLDPLMPMLDVQSARLRSC